MSEEVVPCPACGGLAAVSRTQTNAAGEPVLTAVTDEEKDEKLAQFREVIRLQREQLEAASQRIRDLEEMLRFRPAQPGVIPPPPRTPPGFPNSPFQGKAGAF